MKYCKTTEQAYQALPNIVTEQIVIETKTSARMIPVTADKDSIDEINHAFAIAKKEHERLEKVEELLRLHKYYTDYNLFPSKVVERIKQLEEEMK